MNIWIDLDNTPHVPLFAPIIQELKTRGYSVTVTARDCFQVCDLANLLKVEHKRIGRHLGRHKLAKIAGLGGRALQLLPHIARQKPQLALSHGSRAQLLVAAMLKIPSVLLMDYEFARGLRWLQPDRIMIPEVISDSAIRFPPDRVLRYPGIKEDVYVPRFRPDATVRQALNLDNDSLVVTLRPPATEAHYHVAESDQLFRSVLTALSERTDTRTILLPRNSKQEREIRSEWPALFATGRMIVPEKAMDGLNLLWHSDLVISGGGTMNREAAAMGIPVYSIFRGTIGAVDRYLAGAGRLTLLESEDDVRQKLLFQRRSRDSWSTVRTPAALDSIVGQITSLLDRHASPMRLPA